jgi:hypothetical protein
LHAVTLATVEKWLDYREPGILGACDTVTCLHTCNISSTSFSLSIAADHLETVEKWFDYREPAMLGACDTPASAVSSVKRIRLHSDDATVPDFKVGSQK